MKIEQRKYTKEKGWQTLRHDAFERSQANLVIVFGSSEILNDPFLYEFLQEQYHSAEILMNTVSAEISGSNINENAVSLTAIMFEKAVIKSASVNVDDTIDSYEAGIWLASKFDLKGLRSLLVISDGQKVNGCELVKGLNEYLPKETIITGGMAGGQENLSSTLVGLNETPTEGKIVALGFYGSCLSINSGSIGGWKAFSPEILITKSDRNKLYELDGRPALNIYKMYLGENAKKLPEEALFFPLNIRNKNERHSVIRTIISINEDEKSITLADDIPGDCFVQLMKTSAESLIAGASDAAFNSVKNTMERPDLAILISDIGRKLVLNERTDEEVEAMKLIYGDGTAITGFYSAGEISPGAYHSKSELHNQTMTVTTFKEHLNN